jgi:hypothetical protein
MRRDMKEHTAVRFPIKKHGTRRTSYEKNGRTRWRSYVCYLKSLKGTFAIRFLASLRMKEANIVDTG